MPTFTDSLLPFGPHSPSSSELSPELRRTALRLYRQAWDAYCKAGCPYGETDEAMLVWYSFQQDGAKAPYPVGRN
jgi:hypothetical protein